MNDTRTKNILTLPPFSGINKKDKFKPERQVKRCFGFPVSKTTESHIEETVPYRAAAVKRKGDVLSVMTHLYRGRCPVCFVQEILKIFFTGKI